ncbi:ribonuclease E inhibitor RraB [Flavihumibacter fluvii]|uniref:ribonuclease E inhibitor RraB n=1 Tax=Flavihumibacter fluvii TaxID=2838157 RepID=UPI001BDDF1E3|nr:ribonuclease E inhibitor RraB [Flavihumibacter fluvii]ULQ54665.1 ribonuclease E inhibitor RraB [Flavihumibacter fluvii]
MKLLPLLLLLVSSLGVFSQEETWDVYLADYKGKPGSTVINMGLKIVAPISAYPYVLIRAGDKLEAHRKVDHWAYFKTARERDSFQAIVRAIGFTIEQANKIKKDSMPFQLQFSRVDPVDLDPISKLTTDLKKKAGACHGEYDGWETSVVKE